MSNIDIQIATKNAEFPQDELLSQWCSAALETQNKGADLTLRIVDEQEIRTLNREFRQKDKSTNVLSFPSDLPEAVAQEFNLLGDIIICADVVDREAKEQGKMKDAHWAHMVIHGTLHLQGYDHIDESEAKEMEALETNIMGLLGFPAPYQDHTNT